MAEAITRIAQNYLDERDVFDGLDEEELVGDWRGNIPYAIYTGE